jgi:hypothetical protein
MPEDNKGPNGLGMALDEDNHTHAVFCCCCVSVARRRIKTSVFSSGEAGAGHEFVVQWWLVQSWTGGDLLGPGCAVRGVQMQATTTPRAVTPVRKFLYGKYDTKPVGVNQCGGSSFIVVSAKVRLNSQRMLQVRDLEPVDKPGEVRRITIRLVLKADSGCKHCPAVESKVTLTLLSSATQVVFTEGDTAPEDESASGREHGPYMVVNLDGETGGAADVSVEGLVPPPPGGEQEEEERGGGTTPGEIRITGPTPIVPGRPVRIGIGFPWGLGPLIGEEPGDDENGDVPQFEVPPLSISLPPGEENEEAGEIELIPDPPPLRLP